MWKGCQLVYIEKNNENNQHLVAFSNILKKYDSCPPTDFMETFSEAEGKLLMEVDAPQGSADRKNLFL